MSNEMTLGQLQQVSSGVFSSIANSLIVSSIVKNIHMISKDLEQMTYILKNEFLYYLNYDFYHNFLLKRFHLNIP